jgi:hypothetical protein
VLTDVQQGLLISRNSRNCGLADLRTKNGHPWHRYHQAGTFAETMAILREADINQSQLGGSQIAEVFAKYEALLERHRYFDYTSILSRTVELLETDEAFATRVASRVKFVTVDESRTSTLFRSVYWQRWRCAVSTSALSATTTSSSTTGAAAGW